MEKLQVQHVVTIFYNETNGYGVIKFVTDDKMADEVIAVGMFGPINYEGKYVLHGDFTEHPKYGFQFKVDHYEVYQPSDSEGLIRYFSSPIFPGIGRSTAKDIVDTLGEDVINLIKEDASVLDQVKSVTEKRKQSILEGLDSYDSDQDLVAFLSKFGVSARMIMKIDATYKEDAISVVKDNPYRLMEDIDGIGFKTVDKLALEMQYDMTSIKRARAAILYILMQETMNSGNSFISYEHLKKSVLKTYDFIADFDEVLFELKDEHLVAIEGEDIYHMTQFMSENGISDILHQMLPLPYSLNPEEITSSISTLEDKLKITYDTKQKEAMLEFFTSEVMILTGGPGTGKTTIVKAIINLYQEFFPTKKILCCAPTGRAAKRLSELAEVETMTIHSLLKWDLETNTFQIDKTNPIEADLIIVDEFSMVDQWLFYHFLIGVSTVPQLLFIGDEDQLPSVGPGKVLQDLLEVNQFPVVKLEKIYRQSEGSDVVRLAHDIHNHEHPDFKDMKDVAFFQCQNNEVKDYVMNIVQNALDKGYEDEDIQVLAPMYKGVAGIDTLNSSLQQMLNPPEKGKRELKVGYRTFREGDKILQLKNQPDDNVYNGDIGRLVGIGYPSEDVNHQAHIQVCFDEDNVVEYSSEQFFNLTHAYCISIHKSQGSEYPIVIMPVLRDYMYMLERKLIYTGITRAKKSLVLLGSKEVFEHAVDLESRNPRTTKLKERLIEKHNAYKE